MNSKPSLEKPSLEETGTIRVSINGQSETLATKTTLRSYLESKAINPNIVACELNMKIIKRADFAGVTLDEGDVLEIFRMIGGG